MQTFLNIFNLLLLYLLSTMSVFGQMYDGTFGNEWINHSQSYYKIKITQDGVYSINKQTIQNHIPTIQQVTPQNLQLYYMGEEVPIYVSIVNGQIEGISFYAEKNRGQLDVNLYRDQSHHFNPEYSLISDTSTYFLTWSTTPSQKHFQTQVSNFNNIPSKESYFTYESKKVFSDTWNRGKYRVYGSYQLSNGTFDFGEGYGDSFKNINTFNVNTPNPINIGPTPTITIKGYAFGFSNHMSELRVGNHTETYVDYYGDAVFDLFAQLSYGDISSNNTSVDFEGLYGPNDKYSISVVTIKYSREFDFNGSSMFKFNIESSNLRKYLEIDNFNGGSITNQNVYLYDITNNLRIQCYWDGIRVRAELPPSQVKRELVLINESEMKTVHGLHTTDFVNYSIARGDYIIISHPDLFNDSNGNNPVFDYAAYRTTTGESPVIVPIQRLYDQFSYGVNKHPIAIKNFIVFIKKNWTNIKPKNVFIIGKGRVYTDTRAHNVHDNLIPTFGSPPSDNLLVSPIDSDVPMIPIGRLSATNGDEVTTYLNKVKTLENNIKDSLDFDNQNWRKQVIHLGGGANSWENSILKNHLLNIEPKLENGKFGAEVHSFFKQQDEHISTPNSQMIDSLINNGVSMITFFGHGSTKGFDYYLNAPKHYTNKDKYPLIMALGCYNGTIFNSNKLISEKFILEDNGGAIGYIGFVDAVTISAASNISSKFYDQSNINYGTGIGELLKNTLEDFTSTINYSYNPVFQMGSQYLVFHGDPAIKLNYRTTPDFYINEKTISTSPKIISENIQNFNLLIDIHNLGKYVDSTLSIKIVRTHPNDLIDTTNMVINAPSNKKTIEVNFTVNGYEDFGLNKFSIYVDDLNQFHESPTIPCETNNIVLDYNVMVGNPIITPTYPKEYAIINDSTPTLKAMTTNAFNNDYTWSIELDTTTNFNSTELVNTTIQSDNNLIEWSPNKTLNNNQVYYWRVKALNSNQPSDWVTSSFIYINNSTEGWNQSHVYQYQNNTTENIIIKDSQNMVLSFTPSLYEISATTGYINFGIDNENLALYQNGSKVDKCRCAYENGVYVAVLDPNTLNFWTLPGGSTTYGAVNCDGANRTAYSFLFKNNTSTTQTNFENFVMDSIPDGHMVIIYTLNNAYGQRWSSNLINHLKTQGATEIDTFANATSEMSYAIAYKKNTPNYQYFSEKVGYTKEASISVHTATDKPWHKGTMTSTLIGPSNHWDILEWNVTHLETPQYDNVSVDVFGINPNGEKSMLLSNIVYGIVDLTSIDPNQYPYIQLRLNNEDNMNKTPAQLDYWRVYGDFNTDIALTIEKDYEIINDSTTNQQNMVIELAVWNMGLNNIDSAELSVSLLNGNTITQQIPLLHAADSQNIRVNIPLIGLIDERHLIATIRPLKNESNRLNNWGWLDFNTTNKISPSDKDEIRLNVDDFNASPNPFVSQTLIDFNIDNISDVSVEIYDIRGVLIRILVKNKENGVLWDGKMSNGENAPTGAYFCRLISNNIHSNEIIKIIKY